MSRSLLYKFLAIGGLILLLLIPLGMISSSIAERREFSESVVNDIARSSSYSQTLFGPVLVVPYEKRIVTWQLNEAKERVPVESKHKGQLYFLPDKLQLTSELATERRYRGIYAAHLYHSDNLLQASFSLPAHYGVVTELSDYQFYTPYMALGISDIRGIENSLSLSLNDKTFSLEPGSQLTVLGEGVHAQLQSLDAEQAQALQMRLPLKLQGTSQFQVVPVGRDTQVSIHSSWPHPSFMGDFLPLSPSVSDQGFNAQWQTSYFSTNFAEHFKRCMDSDDCADMRQLSFGVNLIDPVNQYVKTHRAIKYALLFIGLTFAGFFLMEVLKSLQVHPLQYALVGLALALFYLLLLSLAEHIAFGFAYIAAASACVLLIGFYLAAVLRSLNRSLMFSACLATLYAMLYGLLAAEDYALLMGSLLLFAVLGAFMLLTRRVDWYGLGKGEKTMEPGERV